MRRALGHIAFKPLPSGFRLALLLGVSLVFSGCKEDKEPQIKAHIPGTIVTEGIEIEASFGKVESDLSDYLDSALVFPSDAKANRLKNRVRMMFIVQEDGSIDAIKAQDDSDPVLIAEAERVLSEMPAWNPAQKHGQAVATWNFTTLLFTRSKKHIAAKGKPGARPTDFIPYESESEWKPSHNPRPQKPVIHEEGYFEDEKGRIYVKPDLTVSYPGGVRKALNTIHEAIQYPDEALQRKIEGEVRVAALIDAMGHVEECNVVKTLGYGCNEEALRIVSNMNNWIPAMHEGEPVRSIVFIPVDFRLD